MQQPGKAAPLRGFLLFLLGCLVGANATFFVMTRDRMAEAQVVAGPGAQAPRPATETPRPNTFGGDTPPPEPGSILPLPAASMRGTAPAMDNKATASGGSLLIPVQGITAMQLSDTFTQVRSAGRVHDAIDIMAPAGTPVLAVADGHIEKLFNSKLGGLSIYEFNRDGTLAYYYAHLQRYADDLSEQQPVARGQVIGYVGATGNASPEAPHLHFAIFELGPEKQWWKGVALNPYPELGGIPR